jgi:hypothetical protein
MFIQFIAVCTVALTGKYWMPPLMVALDYKRYLALEEKVKKAELYARGGVV